MDAASMLEVYRRDRRRLLRFLLSAAGGGGRALDLSRVDLDAVSADYALECVATGTQFNASEATRRYFDERRYPIMIGSPSGNSYFLLSRPQPFDSPPKEAAPSIGPQAPAQESSSSSAAQPRDFFRDAINTSGIGYGMRDDNLTDISSQQAKKVDILSLDLPRLNTELSDDDIRETAYEVLLASLFVSGKVHFSEEKREKKHKFLKRRRTKTEGSNPLPQVENGYAHILDLIRVQMEASFYSHCSLFLNLTENIVSTRMYYDPRKISESMDALTKRALRHINLRMMKGQIDVPRISLQLLSFVGKLDFPTERLRVQWQKRQANVLEELLLFSGSLEYDMSETLRIVLSKLKQTEARTTTHILYHFISMFLRAASRLYEKLLCSVFDILEDGQLVEEADEILEAVRLTWPILGITEKLHNMFYAWALFQKRNYSIFEATLNLALLLVKTLTEDGCEEVTLIESPVECTPESKLVHLLVVKSIHAAYTQALISSDGRSETEFKHPLTILANELKLVADKECTEFSPILYKYYPEAQRVALIFLHMLYGKQLELFLERMDHLEISKEILAASNNFELFIAQKLYSMYGEAGSSFSNYLKPYMIGRFSSPLILQWLHGQHENVLEWTKRAIGIEDWAPLSVHEKQATSMVEVFRIVEESVDQFFNASLPLDIVHLRSLLIGITSSLQVYLLHMKINKFIRDQLDALEEGIKQSWISVLSAARLLDYLSCMASGRAVSENLSSSDESVDELFTIFDDVRMTAVNITDTILNFIGTRAVFWDMRDSLLFSLYRESVEGARMHIFIPTIDQVLDQVCDLIVDVLRDQVVLRIFQACMEGLIWVLLDGGPSRAFLETDVVLMQQDLAMLKDLFIAEGQGLPLDIVEREAKQAQQILDLYMLKADTIIEMLINASDQMPHHHEVTSARRRHVHDAHTLLRVLCHKKDKIASTFLRIQYHLPRSSDYDDVPAKDVSSKVPMFSDMLKRGTSFNWSETGQQSFRIMKKKLQEATWQ
nr:unnamed protein product [Digitaria exilis]